MNLYDIAIARKLSGGGGGGSSDFSSAKVTITNTTYQIVHFSLQFAECIDHTLNTDFYTGFYISDELGIDIYVDDGFTVVSGTGNFQCYLIPNKNFVIFPSLSITGNISVTGNATKDYIIEGGEEYEIIIVTGDCTITISDVD